MGLNLANQPFEQKISKGAQTDKRQLDKIVFSLYHLIIRCGLKIDNVTHQGQGRSRDAASCISACLLFYSGFCCFYLFWRYANDTMTAVAGPHTLYICIYECVQSTPIQKTLMTCDYGNKIIGCFIGRRTIKRWRGKKKASLSPSPA